MYSIKERGSCSAVLYLTSNQEILESRDSSSLKTGINYFEYENEILSYALLDRIVNSV